MKTVKRIGLIVLTVMMLAALVACGDKKVSSSATPIENPPGTPEQTNASPSESANLDLTAGATENNETSGGADATTSATTKATLGNAADATSSATVITTPGAVADATSSATVDATSSATVKGDDDKGHEEEDDDDDEGEED